MKPTSVACNRPVNGELERETVEGLDALGDRVAETREHSVPPPAADALPRGTTIGRFVVIDELGTGSVDVVYNHGHGKLSWRPLAKWARD